MPSIHVDFEDRLQDHLERQRQVTQGRRGRRSRRRERREEGGSSNTPLPTEQMSCSAGGIHTLPIVPDTIYLSFNIEFSEKLRAVIAQLAGAPGKRVVVTGSSVDMRVEPYSSEADIGDGWVYEATTLKGYSGYHYLAKGVGDRAGVRVIMEHPEDGFGRMMVMIGSALCWQGASLSKDASEIGWSTIRGLDNDLTVSSPVKTAVKISRLDLCVDHWGYEWQLADLDRFARRGTVKGKAASSEKIDLDEELPERWIWKGTQGQTLYLGKRNSQSCFMRIYDKISEACKTGKSLWMEEIWKKHGWDGKQRIWRAEIEAGGEWLRKHGIKNLADLYDAQRNIWEWYTESTRHVQGLIETKRKDLITPVWEALQNAGENQEYGSWEWRPRPPSASKDKVHLWNMIVGIMRSLTAMYMPQVGKLWFGIGESVDYKDALAHCNAELLQLMRESYGESYDSIVQHNIEKLNKYAITGQLEPEDEMMKDILKMLKETA